MKYAGSPLIPLISLPDTFYFYRQMIQVNTYKYTGLAIALVTPALSSILVAVAHLHSGRTPTLVRYLPGELFYWSLFVVLVLIAKYGEKEPVIFWGKNTNVLQTIGTGMLVFISLMAASIVYQLLYRCVLKLPAPKEELMAQLYAFPGWFKALLAIRAGLVEETLFRAYGMSRLTQLTNNKCAAFFIPLLFFALSHIAYGTVNHMAGVFVLGITLAIWYIKTKNLAANMIGHTLLDIAGLFLGRV